MRVPVGVIVIAVLLAVGVVLYPRPDRRVSAARLVSDVLAAQTTSAPIAQMISERLNAGCIPVLEGATFVDGVQTQAVRLKIPPPARYPWLELWIAEKKHRVVAWKEWGVRNGRVQVLRQSR